MGKRYATEAAVAVLDYGISTLKLSGIVAESAVENIGSVRVIERIGMQFEAFGKVRGRKTVCYRQPNEPIAGADTAVATMKPRAVGRLPRELKVPGKSRRAAQLHCLVVAADTLRSVQLHVSCREDHFPEVRLAAFTQGAAYDTANDKAI